MKKILDEFLTAAAFLSRIPIKVSNFTDLSTIYFPLVGFLLGIILSIFLFISEYLFPPSVASFLLVISYIYLTGGVHLDGTADFLDGFFAGRDREKTVEIMHDPNTGVFAVIGLILIIILKYLLFVELYSIGNLIFFLVFPVLSRFVLTVIIAKRKVAEGSVMAKELHSSTEKKDFFTAGVLTILISAVLLIIFGFNYIIQISSAVLAALATAFFIADKAEKKIGGLTGDVYGTIVEVSEIVVLLIFVLYLYK
ncbi:MAG: adenosylcobinamide-GDP ribazoletransferase [Bacillota bacterium]